MVTKKIILGIFVFGILVSLLTNLVSAQSISENVKYALNSFAEIMQPVLEFTLGAVSKNPNSNYSSGEILLIKFLVFILMLGVLFKATTNIPGISDNRALVWIISIVIGVLATRFVTTEQLVNFIWLPSGIVGITLTCLIPLIVFFYFIESFDSSLIRKFGWTLFAVLFFFMAIIRYNTFGGQFNLGGQIYNYNLAWIYIITTIISIGMIIFDRQIRWMRAKAAAKDVGDAKKQDALASILYEIDKIDEKLASRSVMLNEQLSKSLMQQRERLVKRAKQLGGADFEI